MKQYVFCMSAGACAVIWWIAWLIEYVEKSWWSFPVGVTGALLIMFVASVAANWRNLP